MTRAIFRSALVASAAIGSAMVAAPAEAVFPGKPGRIVFTATESIYPGQVLWDVVRRDGKVRRITSSQCSRWQDAGPDYSPDGRRIAYLHTDECTAGETHKGIWVAASNGAGAHLLAPLQEFFWSTDPTNVAWSADGRQVATNVSGPDGATHLVFDAETGVLVASHTDPSFVTDTIDWGPSAQIATATNTHIRALFPQTGKSEPLTFPRQGDPLSRWVAWDDEPDWGPSGRRITFVRMEQRGVDDARVEAAQVTYRSGIWVATRGRPKSAIRLTRGDRPYSPVFSPDGKRIAFIGRTGIEVVAAVGGGRRRTIRLSDQRLSPRTLDWQAQRGRPSP